ncbi:MAG: AI-2E family transporter [Planctomycetaceae bacterium]|nr:AI-2E family transporter [Planctomycetaceae bacterium]
MTNSGRILVTALIATGCLWLATAFSATVIMATEVFLLTFLGVLFAVLLYRCSLLVSKKSGLSYGWSLGTTTLVMSAVFAGTLFLFGLQIEEQIREASSHLDESAEFAREWIHEHPLAKAAVSDLPFASQLLQEEQSPGGGKSPSSGAEEDGSTGDGSTEEGANESAGAAASEESAEPEGESEEEGEETDSGAADSGKKDGQSGEKQDGSADGGLQQSRIGQATRIFVGAFRTTFGLITNFAIVVIVGLYLAADPQLYINGTVRLFPRQHRDRVREISDRLGSVLWSWLRGRMATMLITGAGTGIGLALIGVPLPFMLGVMTGLLAFIPNIGPAIGLAVSLLVSLPQGGNTPLLVLAVFVLFQLLESYLLTPLIQQRMVSIPPALLLVWQVLLGVLSGFLGLMVATPVLAVLMQLVLLVWLEDVLGDQGAAEEPA